MVKLRRGEETAAVSCIVWELGTCNFCYGHVCGILPHVQCRVCRFVPAKMSSTAPCSSFRAGNRDGCRVSSLMPQASPTRSAHPQPSKQGGLHGPYKKHKKALRMGNKRSKLATPKYIPFSFIFPAENK
jgi:hypothetical protein